MRPLWVALAMLFLLPRLTELGTVLTVDESSWRARAHQFLEGIATFTPEKTFTGGQPGVTTMWLAGLATPFASLGASQAAIAIGTTVLTFLALALLARLTNPFVALAGGLLVALDPFVIAHSRVVHTDALLGSFMLLTMLLLALAWRTGEGRYAVYAGVTAALAALTKLFGLFLLLPAAAFLFLPRSAPGPTGSLTAISEPSGADARKEIGRRFLRFSLPFIAALLLFWPALLFSPAAPLAFMTSRAGLHYRSAGVGSGGGDPWYYPREFLRRLTPTTTILLPLVAVGLAVGTGKRLPAFPARGALAALLGTSLLYAAALSVAEQKSDRYILFAHLALDIAAGASLVWLGALLTRTRPAWRVPATVGLVAAAALFLAGDVLRLHPRFMAHWNRLLPIPADAKFGWGEGLEEASAYLRSLNLPPAELTTASYYPGVLAHFLPGARVERFTQYASPDFRFVILYRSMYGRDPGSYETDAITKFLGGSPTEGTTVTVDGTPFRLEKIVTVGRLSFAWVFRRLEEPRKLTAL